MMRQRGDGTVQLVLVVVAGITGAFIAWQAWETRKTAKASVSGIELIISKDRARISINVNNINPCSQEAGFNSASALIENTGPTQAFVKDFRARLVRTSEKEVPANYSECHVAFYHESIQGHSRYKNGFLFNLEPNPFMTTDEVIEVHKEQSFIHFYGFADYRDVFDRNRRTTIHLRWTMKWGGVIPGEIIGWWTPVGPAHENDDVEIV